MKVTPAFILLIAMIIMSGIGCTPRNEASSHASILKQKRVPFMVETVSNPDVRRVVTLIDQCPAWAQVTPLSHDTTNRILSSMKQISREKTATIFSAEEIYSNKVNSGDDPDCISELSKLFILNRYIFNVPPRSQTASHVVGITGYMGMPLNKNSVDDLWPLSKDAAGNLLLTGRFSGYSGGLYRFENEFNVYDKTYGRR